jgi:RNA polymerase sigma-70 factor (ECF subfamily)
MKTINVDTIAAAVAGNQEAASGIYLSMLPKAKGMAFKIMRSFPNEREDAVQDVMAHLFRKLPKFRGESAFSTWSHRVIHNYLLAELRKRRGDRNPANCVEAVDTRPGDESLSPFHVVSDPRNSFAQIDAAIDGKRILARMAKGYRQSLELVALHGFSHEECSKITGTTIGNSKSQWHKAKQRAREIADDMEKFKEETGYSLPIEAEQPVIAARILDQRRTA